VLFIPDRSIDFKQSCGVVLDWVPGKEANITSFRGRIVVAYGEVLAVGNALGLEYLKWVKIGTLEVLVGQSEVRHIEGCWKFLV